MEDEVDVAVAEPTPIEDLINTVADQDFSKAGPTFAEIMQSKIDTALEQEKISIANQVFNNAEPEEMEAEEETDELDDDISDEEIDDAIDETEEELEDEE
jgi:hypothetical protein